MDILKLIKQDHDRMKEMFDTFEDLKQDVDSNETALLDTFAQLKQALNSHMEAEEEVVYPKLKDYDASRPEIMESIEEHHVARLLLREIESVQMGEKWVAKMSVFKENVQHHVEEEEEEMFELMRELLDGAELKELGSQFQRIKG